MTALRPVSPGSTLTFTMDWSDWLPAGTMISTYLWTITPDEGSMLQFSDQATVAVSGCLRGKDYVLTEQVTNNGTPPITGKRSFLLRCETNL